MKKNKQKKTKEIKQGSEMFKSIEEEPVYSKYINGNLKLTDDSCGSFIKLHDAKNTVFELHQNKFYHSEKINKKFRVCFCYCKGLSSSNIPAISFINLETGRGDRITIDKILDAKEINYE